jgi:hypothetical protein
MSPQRGGWWPEQCLFTALALILLTAGGIAMACMTVAGAW